MLSNMATSLIVHKRITTTVAKAKALRVFVEPVLTRSKTDSTHNRREAFKHLRDKDAVAQLFSDVGPKIADRPGGYVRIIKLGTRMGDAADMAMIELVDFNETMLSAKKPKTRRSRRGGGKKSDEPTTQTTDETAATEEKSKPAAVKKTESEEKPEEKAEQEAPRTDVNPEDTTAAQQAKATQDEESKNEGQKARETEADEAAKRAKARGQKKG